MTTASNGKEQKEIDNLLAEAERLRRDRQNEKAMAIALKVLEMDPTNKVAKSLRDEIDLEGFRDRSVEDQAKSVDADLKSAETQFNSGELEKARTTIDSVLVHVPNDPRARSLKEKISSREDRSQ